MQAQSGSSPLVPFSCLSEPPGPGARKLGPAGGRDPFLAAAAADPSPASSVSQTPTAAARSPFSLVRSSSSAPTPLSPTQTSLPTLAKPGARPSMDSSPVPPPPPRRSVPHPAPPKRTVKAEPKPFLPYSSDQNIAVSKNETWSEWRKRKTSGWGTYAVTKVSRRLFVRSAGCRALKAPTRPDGRLTRQVAVLAGHCIV